jgi:NAD(P)-dependent dehydrogenase (short-subunit alcohol dehydrogenase family)
MLRLDGKVALVTGCGSFGPGWGNGRATAALLARQGAIVIGIDRDREAAEITRSMVEAERNQIAVSTCDVTDFAQVEALIADIRARYGRLDLLVNNVGRSEPGNPVTMDEDVWDEQITLNLKSVFLTCKHAIPVMVEQGGGAIVNISSVAGIRFVGKDQVGYAAAKAGLMHSRKSPRSPLRRRRSD